MGKDTTRNGSLSVAKGDNRYAYLSDYNYGGWKQNGGNITNGVTNTVGEYDIGDGTVGAYAKATGAGFCGAIAKVGVVIEIESGDSVDGLEIIPTAQYEGYLGVNGAGTAKVKIGGEVAEEGASDFANVDSNSVISHQYILNKSKTAGAGYARSWDGTVTLDGNDGVEPLYISSPEVGDRYRVDIYAATTAECAISYASVESNAGGSGVIDDLVLSNVRFNWV